MHNNFIESLISKLKTINHLFIKHLLHQSKLKKLGTNRSSNSAKTPKEDSYQVKRDESSFAAKV